METNGSKHSLFGTPKLLRNICIMAHVDHGKTTLADALVASNGIITKRQAGKIRYMDSRKDEIERGITMKSSCITLTYPKEGACYVVNLIDSPGHVDFSSEVSTAVRLCDGTIIVVDVVEGVCAQTKVVLKQAWLEDIKPVLVLNKIDRLILEMKLSPLDAYYHLVQVLEQINAYMAELYNMDVMGRMADEAEAEKTKARERHKRRTSSEGRRASESNVPLQISDWYLSDVDDSELYFVPVFGNVVFASAIDGWGFRLDYFAEKFAGKLDIEVDQLKNALWGDYYASTKGGKKCILGGAREKRKNPLFVSLILDNIYKLYDAIINRKDSIETEKMAESLRIKLPVSVAKSTDPKVKAAHIFSQWLPLANSILDMVIDQLPSAGEITDERACKLMCSATQRFDSLPEETQRLKAAFTHCSNEESAPLIVYVSKMFGVESKHIIEESQRTKRLHVAKKGLISDEELEARREQIRSKEIGPSSSLPFISNGLSSDGTKCKEICDAPQNGGTHAKDEEVLIAFARVFSGTLKIGQKVYVLGPKHNPNDVIKCFTNGQLPDDSLQNYEHISTCEVSGIYLLMGRELQSVRSAPAGSMIGIGGLENFIIKSATLSSTPFCSPFTELTLHATPILRVALEPSDPKDLPSLRSGLKILNQADPCVEVLLQDSGEYIIATAGEIHLQRCIDDLQERYAKVPITASPPIVPFRETIVPRPSTDRVNEAIKGENVIQGKLEDSSGCAQIENSLIKLRIRAIPLPRNVTSLLEENSQLLSMLSSLSSCKAASSNSRLDDSSSSVGSQDLPESRDIDPQEFSPESSNNYNSKSMKTLSHDALIAINNLKLKLKSAFDEAGSEWRDALDQLWSIGPHYNGPNILLNRTPNYKRPSLFQDANEESIPDDFLKHFDANFIIGFQLATAAGPLCEEPMMGIAFIVEKWEVDHSYMDSTSSISGQIISLVKDTIRKAFVNSHQRIMSAMYSCVISVTSEVIGRMYNVIGKRQGRIIDGDITEGSTSWNITAFLPVIESFNFANELRKSTSGEAMPQLIFSHWEILDIDPHWEPQTTEELAHWGEKADSQNIARKYINSVRNRKGLHTDDKIVEHAEKQRNLSKNK